MNTLIDPMRTAVDPCATRGAQPLPVGDDGEPVFAEPWQAQVFASTVVLSQRGLFGWKQWVDVFAAEIAANPQRDDESPADAYFRQWMAALETLLAMRGVLTREHIGEAQEHWRRSYLNTEHGQPVQFSRAWAAPDPAVERWLAEHAHEHHHDEPMAPRPIAVSPARGRPA